MVLIFLVTKVIQKGTISAYRRPLPSEKSPLGSPVKIALLAILVFKHTCALDCNP